MQVSPHDASSDPDDGVFILDAFLGHARQKNSAEFRPNYSVVISILS